MACSDCGDQQELVVLIASDDPTSADNAMRAFTAAGCTVTRVPSSSALLGEDLSAVDVAVLDTGDDAARLERIVRDLHGRLGKTRLLGVLSSVCLAANARLWPWWIGERLAMDFIILRDDAGAELFYKWLANRLRYPPRDTGEGCSER